MCEIVMTKIINESYIQSVMLIDRWLVLVYEFNQYLDNGYIWSQPT